MTVPRLLALYENEIIKKLQTLFSYRSRMEVPRVKQISLNMGVGKAAIDKKFLTNAMIDLEKISGQKSVMTLAKRSISEFKIRAGWPIGCKVTLRRKRMYEFLDRLITIVFPRVRDFRGLNMRSFDGRGNYSIGIKEQLVFPEIDYDKIDTIRGLDITIVTSANNNREACALLRAFNFPLKEEAS